MQHRHLRSFLIHLSVWCCFAGYEQLTALLTRTPGYAVSLVLIIYLLNAALFYANSLVLLPALAGRRRYWQYALAASALLAAYGLLRWGLYVAWPPAGPAHTFGQHWLLAVYRGMFFLFASLGYWLATHVIHLREQERNREHQLREAEKSAMEANLAFLRNQINPHFLFNTLNFLYAQVYPHSAEAAQGVLLLSGIMRYALHENSADKVPLEQEIAHVENYLQLNQLRFHHQLQVDFQLDGSPRFLLLAPLVLITFVENCFKHGDLSDPADPLRIYVGIRQNVLTFETRNKKRHGPREVSHGIGLANIRQRLNHLYPGGYTLVLQDEADHYTCRLTVAL